MTTGGSSSDAPPAPRGEEDLEELLSRPTLGVRDALVRVPGDIVVLGAGGKMGPSLVAMLRRAANDLADGRTIHAVSRFSTSEGEQIARRLERDSVRVWRADLLDREAVASLPDAPNVIYMAGQKFGTSDVPALTWVTNTVVPSLVADRYHDSHIVAFSTGNVYPLRAIASGGSREGDAMAPVGEYAASCVGRERVLEHASRTRGTPIAIIRLNYAVDLRYGVLVDIAQKVAGGTPVDVGMGYVNCIWQGDANATSIRALEHAASPPFVLNVTGADTLSVREIALALGRLLGREPSFTGRENADALLSDTTRMQSFFGAPSVASETLISWVAEWTRRGGRTLGKATRFESRDGTF